MSGWLWAGLVVLVVALYLAYMFWRILRDGRPPKRWPGDP